jgi:hypothetical protein
MKNHPPRFFYCFLVLLFCGTAVFSLPAQKILYPGDSIYDDLTALSMEQGVVFLSGSAITVAQAELMFAKINDEELSASGKILYERVRSFFAKPATISRFDGLFALDFNPGLQPELYYKTNDALDWIYDHNSRQPFLSLPVSVSVSSYITLESELYIRENRRFSHVDNNYFNFPFETYIDSVTPIDTNAPKRAYLSAGFPFGKGFGVHVKFGLGDDTLGRTKTGSIILSDNMRGFSYGNLTLYAPFISYAASVMELEVTKYLYLHQLQLKILDRLSLSLIEGVMVNAPFEIRYVNPIMIFHSFSAWESYGDYNEQIGNDTSLGSGDSRVGSYLGISVDFRPWKKGRFYGLFAMNQLELPGERTSDSKVPDGLAFQWGYESWLPVAGLFSENSVGHVTFGLEGVYTYPYMYILGDKGWSFYREFTEVSNGSIRDWVGTSFGPDSAAAAFWVGYHDLSRWSAELFFLFLAQGVNADTAVFDLPNRGYTPQSPAEATASSPTGKASYTYLIKTKGRVSPKKWLDIVLQPAYKIVSNHNHISDNLEHGFELALSVRFIPELRFKGKK